MEYQQLEALESGRYILSSHAGFPRPEHELWTMHFAWVDVYTLEGEFLGRVADVRFPHGVGYQITGYENADYSNPYTRLYRPPDDHYYIIAECKFNKGTDEYDPTIEATECIFIPAPHWVQKIHERIEKEGRHNP